MTEMTDSAVLKLRIPFPPETIGKLPKPVKRDDLDKGKCEQGSRYSADGHYCGGWHSRSMHLDYVGHAAVTDRLLTVDPTWSWEPLALDPAGLPALDRSGNLWIKLTICGVTRIGVGDGKSAKECIGDAIRNAAMRFGVALDLWAKEDLVEFAQAAQSHRRPAEPAPSPQPAAAAGEAAAAGPTITEAQSKKLHALVREKGLDRDRKIQLARWATGFTRELESTSELTRAEAAKAIDFLEQMEPEPQPEATAS